MIIPATADLAASLGKLAQHGPLLGVAPVPGLGYVASTPGIAHLRAGLSAEQAEVFDAIKGDKDILVLAGPGSGKTKTLVATIAHTIAQGVSPEAVIAISFTNNSAAELKVRLTNVAEAYGLPALNRVHVSTFHSWVSQLEARRITPWKFPPIGLKTASFALALDLKNPNSVEHRFTKAEVAAAERHLENCETFDAMETRDFNRIGMPGSKGVNRLAFDHLKQAASDLESAMADAQIGTFGTIMKSGAALAGELQSGEVAWLFIDEAQDLNAPQEALVDALQTSKCRVFAIADDDQGIYKFRGASSRFLRNFESRKNTRTFQLNTNFRSTRPIVQACVNWITPNWIELNRKPKALTSSRPGLPVVLLSAWKDADRGRHARIIIEACLKAGLVKAYGEVAALGYSPGNMDRDLTASKLPVLPLADLHLPDQVLEEWLELLQSSTLTGDWHHPLWDHFMGQTTAHQTAAGETAPGHPGLDDLYASLEVFRRLMPAASPKKLADHLSTLTANKPPFTFTGAKPDPDYKGDHINYLSFHSSKGMEFPVVWVTGGAYALSVTKKDVEEGQPNLDDEQGEPNASETTASSGAQSRKKAPADLKAKNEQAAILEKRRLLYVAMSRASDLLMISLAPVTGKPEAQTAAENYRKEITTALDPVGYYEIANDTDALAFAATIRADHRNPNWTAPHRYRVESYTSLTRQPCPGEIREVEIPRKREFPKPQSHSEMIGDLFHRVMHLLALEPALLQARLAGSITNADLIQRVSHLPLATLGDLDSLLAQYFGDTANQPWLVFNVISRSEVPFSHVTLDPATKEEVLVKGFIDLVAYHPDGSPRLILDYKIGKRPTAGGDIDASHASQLYAYREALCATYAVTPGTVELVNYYVDGSSWVRRL